MALLCVLLGLKHHAGGRGELTAVHVNHQLRGEHSDADAQWLGQQCDQLGVPLQVELADVATLAQLQGDGLERAARDERYRILTAAAEKLGARYVALGHHRDDQVETVLFRVLRGTGLRGLAGMPRERQLSESVSLVRPLLSISRDELHGYLGELGQEFREDGSNAENQFARNRLRNALLPQLREDFNADVDEALLRTARQAGEAYAVVHSQAEELLAKCLQSDGLLNGGEAGEFILQTGPLMKAAPAVLIEVIRIAWRNAGLPEQGMTDLWWRNLAELATAEADSAQLNLPGNVLARCEGGQLRVWRAC